MDKSTAKLLGTIYIALCAGLSEEGVELANNVLLNTADRPGTNEAEAEILRAIATSAGMKAQPDERPHLHCIAGGAA